MSNLFEVTGDVVDKNGFYHGHSILFDKMEKLILHFEEILLKNISSDKLGIIRRSFFKGLFERHYEAQQFLAQKYLRGKRVRVTGGIVMGREWGNSDLFFVFYGQPYFCDFKKDLRVLFSVSLGVDRIGKIWVTKNTEIQIYL